MDYRNYPFRFVNAGLNLRDATDKVGEGNWVRLRNVLSKQEGQLQARSGFSFTFTTGVVGYIHSIKRIDSTTLIIGNSTGLFRNGTAYTLSGFSGNPLSLVPYRPSLTSQNYMYVADSLQMRKVKSDGTYEKWGITGPGVSASFAAGAAGNLNSSVAGGTVYDWRYTYYSTGTGAESNPSGTGNGISVVNQQGVINVNASTDPQVDQIRIYRRGGTISTWRLSVTTTNTTGAVNDNNGDSSIAANEALTEDHDVPFTSVDSIGNTVNEVPLPYAWGPFAGKYIFACGDPNRPGFLYWTNPQRPDEADVENNVEVTSPSEPLQNGFIYASLPFVFSKDALYAIDFGQATAIIPQPRKTACGKGLAAPWAFTVGDRIYFLSNDGIYATDGGQETRLSEPIRQIFKGLQIGDFSPVDYSQATALRMEYHESELWFFYQTTSGDRRWLIYDIVYDRWRNRGDTQLTSFCLAYSDENVSVSALRIGGMDGAIYTQDLDTVADGGTSPYPVQARTGSIDFGLPSTIKELGNLIIDMDTGGTSVGITPYLDAETSSLPTQIISGAAGRQKYVISLSDTFAYSLGIDITWISDTGLAPVIYAMEVMWRPDQEVLKHWEYPESTNVISGWQHIRDGYITVRSTDDLTFVVTIDGIPYTAVFKNASNTSNEKRKVYFELPPAKGKVFKYEINSPGGFRIYGEECEVRTKAWNTQVGYQLITPFAGGDT